jgi:peptide chain release factor subunit 1
MTVDQQLQSLLDYQGDRVLSVYLDTDLSTQSKEAVRLTFRQRAAEVEAAAAHEVEAVQRFLDFEYDWQPRGLAIFASRDTLWEVIPLPIPPRTRVTYTERPLVRPLTDIGDRLGRYAVAVLDREHLRLFSMAWGKIQSEKTLTGEELKRHKQGGWSATGYQRHEDNLALHNLKQAVEAIQEFTERTGHGRLMLGGSTEVLAQVKEMLPRPLADQLIGEFVVDVGANPNEVLSRSLDLAQEVDLQNEQRQVEQAITEAAKGGQGVTGLSDTLYALHQGQVRLLLVDESYRASGYLCSDCGLILAEKRDQCPLCHSEHLEEAADVVNVAIHKAAETGAQVDIVRENAELLRVGGIAALTRY